MGRLVGDTAGIVGGKQHPCSGLQESELQQTEGSSWGRKVKCVLMSGNTLRHHNKRKKAGLKRAKAGSFTKSADLESSTHTPPHTQPRTLPATRIAG